MTSELSAILEPFPTAFKFMPMNQCVSRGAFSLKGRATHMIRQFLSRHRPGIMRARSEVALRDEMDEDLSGFTTSRSSACGCADIFALVRMADKLD